MLLARFLGMPAGPQQIAHERGKGESPYTLEDLSRIAKQLGLVGRSQGEAELHNRDSGAPRFDYFA